MELIDLTSNEPRGLARLLAPRFLAPRLLAPRFLTTRVLAGLAVLALMVGLPATSQQAWAQQSGEEGASNVQIFGDWHLRCQPVPVAEATTVDACALFQNLVNPEDQKPIMQVAAGFWGPERKRGLILKLPLGVTLPAGIELLVDEQPKSKAPFVQCFPDGCQAHVLMDDALVQAMQAGIKAKIAFRNLNNRPMSIGFSLKGFTKGFAQAK